MFSQQSSGKQHQCSGKQHQCSGKQHQCSGEHHFAYFFKPTETFIFAKKNKLCGKLKSYRFTSI